MYTLNEITQFAIDYHQNTNHTYGLGLPYAHHLRMVVEVCDDYIELIPQGDARHNVISACWMHDLVEDCRCTYNDIKNHSNAAIADIVIAVTNYTRGKNRSERMPDFVYHDIVNTPYATFVKLCDRIANAKYSQQTNSRMLDFYRKENTRFRQMLWHDGTEYQPMWNELHSILGI